MMAEENVSAQAPTRTDEQILPRHAWLKIGKSNLLLDLQKMQKNPIFHISVDILRNTNFFRAFTASANVPSIYIQQFWNTMSYDAKTWIYRCQIDEQWFTLSADLLCKALEITPVDSANPFDSPPAREPVMDFVNELGYPEPIHFISKMRGIVTGTNVGHAELLWEEFTQGIKTFFSHKDSNKKTIPLVIPYCRFTKLIIYYLGSKHNIHRRPESAVHVTADDLLLGNFKFIPKGKKDEVFGMPIPKHLITEAIHQSPYYQNYLDMVARYTKAKEGGREKTASEVEKTSKPAPVKPKKPAPAKQSKQVKEKTTEPTPPKIGKRGKVVKKVRKGKTPLRLVDEEEEIQQEPELQGESEDSDVERAIKLSLDSSQARGEGEGEDYDYEHAIKMSLDSFQAQRQAPVGGVGIREPITEEIRKLPEVEGKGKAIVTEEQAAHSLLDLHQSKKKNDTSEKVVQETSSPSYSTSVAAKGTDSERTNSEIVTKVQKVDKEQGEETSTTVSLEEKAADLDEDQAGSDPSKADESRSTPGHDKLMNEDFYAAVYPKVHENLKVRTNEHVILENPPSPSGTLLSMKNLDNTDNFGDQFLNDKSIDDVSSLQPSIPLVHASIITATTETPTTILAQPPPPLTQSSTDYELAA
ncbi:hypothetical protein Tco_0242611 [Tanacetum coccineum]